MTFFLDARSRAKNARPNVLDVDSTTNSTFLKTQFKLAERGDTSGFIRALFLPMHNCANKSEK